MSIQASIQAKSRRLFHVARVATRIIRLPFAKRIIIGAAETNASGWIATNRRYLDVTDRRCFSRFWKPGTRQAFLAEHVWEHLDPREAGKANQNCFEFLRPGGWLRLAVPDGLHPDPEYIEAVKPSNDWPQHRVLYDYRSLSADLVKVGFDVALLEYWSEDGEFHESDWSDTEGYISRCKAHDPRNSDGVLRYTSLIVDAIKPVSRAR